MNIQKEEIITKIENIQPFPAVLSRLFALLDDPNVDYDKIEEIVRLDAGLSAQILRECNSPFWGLNRRIISLKEAINYLGTRQLRNIVLFSGAVPYLCKPMSGYEERHGELLRHSFAVAFLAQTISDDFPMADRSLVFISGLLHDIGKLVLNQFVLDHLSEIIERSKQQQIVFAAAEKQFFNIDHSQIGGMLLREWNFPDDIVFIVENHHNVRNVKFNLELSLVAYANQLCHVAGISTFIDGVPTKDLPYLSKQLQLEETAAEKYLAGFLEEIEKFDAVIQTIVH